jgi:alkanesulfonate monooxygenase SsuD/methylene tetrahydromethanopterin reductase-like flavin-dependent oxidoreductase (luciferase family)
MVLLRRLWTEEVVSFEGEFHTVHSSGIQILPTQRPIPLWIAGDARAVLERVGRVGDGWYLKYGVMPDHGTEQDLELIRRTANEQGRPADAIGIQARVEIGGRTIAEVEAQCAAWRRLGATHVALDTHIGFTTVEGILSALTQVAAVVPLG